MILQGVPQATLIVTHDTTECPTHYRTRHFYNNFTVSQQLGALQTHTTDKFLFISHTTNVLLFKFRCNIFIGVRIIKEKLGSAASGRYCTFSDHTRVSTWKVMYSVWHRQLVVWRMFFNFMNISHWINSFIVKLQNNYRQHNNIHLLI